jgi:hypothetical protein
MECCDIESVDIRGFQRWPDLVADLDWREPMWNQILALVHDSEMALPENLGNMNAAEFSRGSLERDKSWIVTTHGVPRSEERGMWMAAIDCSPAAAKTDCQIYPTISIHSPK